LPPLNAPVSERERIRKAELTSMMILAIFIILVALLSNSLTDPSTGEAVGAMFIFLIIASILNRTGRTRSAAYLVPIVFMLLIMAAIVQAKGGLTLIWFPAYDLLAIPVIISSLTADRTAPWILAAAASIFIVADFLLAPQGIIHAPAFGASAYQELQYQLSVWGPWGLVNRHVILVLSCGFLGWLGARSVDGAIRRADRAEEIAHLESLVADQKRALDYGVDQLTQAFVRSANGDFGARVNIPQQNPLWGVGAQMNTFVQRLGAANQASFELERARQEAYRLAIALDDWRAGRIPIWPAPSGTVVDPVIQRLSGARPQISDSSSRSLNPPPDSGNPYSGWG
jgi:hypothetical protein